MYFMLYGDIFKNKWTNKQS